MLALVATDLIINKSFLDHGLSFSSKYIEFIAANYKDDYYEDQPSDEYNDENHRQPKQKYSPRENTFGTLGGLLKNQKQLGAGLVGAGVLLTVMGMMLFFEGTLLRLGNICIIAGIPLLIGVDRVRSFFVKESRIQASTITAIGILLVFWGKPRLGILFEVFGLMNLFGNMFPFLFALGRRLPIIGDIIIAVEGKNKEKDRARTPRRAAPIRQQKKYHPDF